MVNEGGVSLEIKLIYFVFDLGFKPPNYRVGIRADSIRELFKVFRLFGALFDLIPISVNLLTIRNFIINEINQHKTKQRVQLDNYSIIHVSINWNIG